MEQPPKPELSTEPVPKVKPKIRKRIVPNYGRLPESDSGKIDLPTASPFGKHLDLIVHYFFCLISTCFLTVNEFERFIGQMVLGVDEYEDRCAFTKKRSEYLQYIFTTKGPPSFVLCPTVALRLHSPSGWTIIVRALLDTGCTVSKVSEDLAQRLLSEGDASVRYLWPNLVNTFYSCPQSFSYRTIPGLRLQSLENEQLLTDKHTFGITKNTFADELPVSRVAAKMRKLGVKMFNSARGLSSKEKSMLNGKVVPNNDQARIDLLIGQDLLTRYFNINPKPPQYHLNDGSLIIERTRMGLVFKGTFDEAKFSKWNPGVKERRRMKDTLYPREIMTMESALKLKEDAEEFKKILTVKLEGLTMRQMSSILPHVCLFLHLLLLLLLLLMATGIALFFKSFNQLLLKHFSHFRLFSKLLSIQLSSFLVILYRLANYIRLLYIRQIVPIFCRLFHPSILPDTRSPFRIDPMMPVAVQSVGVLDLPINQLVAYVDTGSSYSYICPKVAQELGLVEAVSEIVSGDEARTKLRTLKIRLGPLGKDSLLKEVQVFVGYRPFKRSNRFYLQPSIQEPLFKRLGFVGPYLPSSYPNNYDIILGTDLLNNHFPVQEFHQILPDLSLVKIPLGVYFQGTVENLTMQNVLSMFKSRLLKEMTWKQTFAVALLTAFYFMLVYLFC